MMITEITTYLFRVSELSVALIKINNFEELF